MSEIVPPHDSELGPEWEPYAMTYRLDDPKPDYVRHIPTGEIVTRGEARMIVSFGWPNRMDAPGGPQCACGKPSVFQSGCCADCGASTAP